MKKENLGPAFDATGHALIVATTGTLFAHATPGVSEGLALAGLAFGLLGTFFTNLYPKNPPTT